ncbi:hypothetical protein F5Y11DRAFT_328362 [Daldinia sp. FL1419]|nr:hypothetical protein F5Y11DRAFT_328362 [Daldinia sp. FL1419]
MTPYRSFHSSQPPAAPTGQGRRDLLKLIDIYHPGYPDLNPLLSLHASDKGGIHYTLVYYACCIVAGNIWHEDEGRLEKADTPFLSESRNPTPIKIPEDDILKGRRYYFHNPKYPTGRYPIVSSFDRWIFPDKLPAPWESLRPSLIPANETTQESEPPPAVACHTESCRVTGHLNALDMAHIVPEACGLWFRANFMREYASSSTVHNNALNDTPNRVPLRTDIHRLWDKSNLAIVPKPNPKPENAPKNELTAPRTYTLATHVLRPPGKSDDGNLELIQFYHNLKTYSFIGNPIEYLFARFAWSLFVDTIMLLFQGKDAKRTKFFVSVSEESNESKDRQAVYRETKNPPLPRSGAGEKPHSTKRSRSEMEGGDVDNADDIDDTESTNSYGSTVYDEFFEDIHSEYNGSEAYSPRKRSRSSSSGDSKYN